MIRYFWKYRFFNLSLIVIGAIFCAFNLTSIKVFFDSERIIKLANVEKDVIDKSIDDKNLLLVGLELHDSLSYTTSLKIDSLIINIQSNKYIQSVNSILNEQVIISQSIIPVTIDLIDFDNEDNFNSSIKRLEKYNSRFITSDLKKLVFIIKCQNLEKEDENINLLDYLENQFSILSNKDIHITGQIKSEIYMKKNIIEELVLFILLSALICSVVLFYFFRNYKLIIVCLFSILFSIIFSLFISNLLFGGVELVMIIIPAIIFIINISDYMHLLNTDGVIRNKYKLFYIQLMNIGRPVFLTSLTTAIGFLSFTFSSFEPLMRFGVVTTLSIFTCLFIIVTFFALSVDFNLNSKNRNIITTYNINNLLNFLNPYRKWILTIFITLSIIGFLRMEVNNYLTDELNHSSDLYQEINFIEKNFGGIKPITFSLVNASENQSKAFINFIKDNDVHVDVSFNQNDTTLIKARIKDLGALSSKKLYDDVINFSNEKDINLSIGGVGYLFDQVSNTITYEVLAGLLIAILIVGLLFVIINKFNIRYLFVSLTPNLIPLLSCLGLFTLFGFYLGLSNAFIFAIVFGLIVDDSIHIISAYSINRQSKKSIEESIRHCKEKTYHAVIKTTLVIIISVVPLLFSEFRSISQLASITIISALFALLFDVLFLPILLKKYIK